MMVPNSKTFAGKPFKKRPEKPGAFLAGGGEKKGAHRGGRVKQGLTCEQRWEIISAYFQLLEEQRGSIGIESDLPYRKDLIRLVILQELVENPNSDCRSHLEIAYVQLEAFIPYEEYKIITDFKDASMLAQELANSGDPASIIRSAQLMKNVRGDRAVAIQERISDQMRKRHAQIRTVGEGRIPGHRCFENSLRICRGYRTPHALNEI